MTKEEAQREVIRRWRELPVMNRQTYREALAFAELLVPAIDFHTMASKQRMIEAWLLRDLDQKDVAIRLVEAKVKAAQTVSTVRRPTAA